MSTHLSIHYVKSIRASSGGTSGAPLTIEIKGDGSIPHSVTLFTDDLILNDRLVEAINKIDLERYEEKFVVESRVRAESQAYAALDEVHDYNHRPDDDEEVVF